MGYNAWYGCSVMPCVYMLKGCIRVFNMCKCSGTGLDLACNLIVLLFHVSTFYCIRVLSECDYIG